MRRRSYIGRTVLIESRVASRAQRPCPSRGDTSGHFAVRTRASPSALVVVVAALIGLWEVYRWIWTSAGWTWPFVVDDTSMPHVWTILEGVRPSRRR